MVIANTCAPRTACILPPVRMAGARLNAANPFAAPPAFLRFPFDLTLVGWRLFLGRGRVLAHILVLFVCAWLVHRVLQGLADELTAPRWNRSALPVPTDNGFRQCPGRRS